MLSMQNAAGYRDHRRARIAGMTVGFVCLIAAVATLSFLSRQADASNQRYETQKNAAAAPVGAKPVVPAVNPIDTEVKRPQTDASELELITAIEGFEAAYFTARFDDHPADHRARIERYVSDDFIDQADSYGNGLELSLAEVALKDKKIIVLAKVARRSDIFVGPTPGGDMAVTAKVTLKTVTSSGKPRFTTISDTTFWSQINNRWVLVTQGADGGGGTG